MKYSLDLGRSDMLDQLLSRCQIEEDTNEKRERQHKQFHANISPASATNGLDQMIQCVEEVDWGVVLALEI